MNFEEFNNIFGMVSDLYDEKKERLWLQCIGKKVRWKGKTQGISRTLMGQLMNVVHGDTSVEVKLDSSNKDLFSQVNYGNTVVYTGKLVSRVTKIFPYKLKDGAVLHIENTIPDPLLAEELLDDPFTPQGPKKITIIESFEDLDNLFGSESRLSEEEKKNEWKKYEGKYISWTGEMGYIKQGTDRDFRVGIFRNNKACIELNCCLSKQRKISKLKEGETVYYSGKLTTMWGKTIPYILKEADIFVMR